VGSETGASALCDVIRFDALFAPEALRVGTSATVDPNDVEFGVLEVLTLPFGSGELCGRDVALLVLADDAGGVPRTPDVTDPLVAETSYSIAGFGAVDASGAGVGARRRRDGFEVTCVGEACGDPQVHPDEWLGGAGVCIGDSGGPAIDAAGHVVGVISRGPPSCATATFGSTFAWSTFLIDGARHAADVGGYAAPMWAGGPSVEDKEGEPVEDGCAMAPGSRGGRHAGWLLAFVALALRRQNGGSSAPTSRVDEPAGEEQKNRARRDHSAASFTPASPSARTDASNCAAARRAGPVTLAPVSMRASSATRSVPSTRSMVLVVASSP
jgi:hypothetical protein